MKLKRWLFALSLLILVALLAGLLTIMERDRLANRLKNDDCAEQPCEGGRLAPLWGAPTFEGLEQHGQPFTQQNLQGHIWIANFIFTTCTSACPLMTSRLLLVQREVRDPNIRFVSFSVDPEQDVPSVLNAYASSWNASESRWTLVQLNPEQLEKVIAGFKVEVLRTQNVKDPVIHSPSFFLIDGKGSVRGIYNSEWGERLRDLIDDAHTLVAQSKAASASGAASGGAVEVAASAHGAPERPLASALTGAQLFEQLSCQACHLHKAIAPPLAGLPGRIVTLDNGTTVTADDAYLRESILTPAQKVVGGYLKLMPYYRDFLSDEDVNKLVAHIHTLEAPQDGPASADSSSAGGVPARIEKDLVCGMDVVAREDAIQTTHQGKAYYFCAESCRRSFIDSPETYLGRLPANP